MIRKAQTRDIPQISILFSSLIDYLKKQGVDSFTAAPDRLVGGLIEFIVNHMSFVRHIVLVNEDGGKIVGFLVGRIAELPKYFEHCVQGEIEAMHPLSFAGKPLIDLFDAWAEENGATARAVLAPPENEIGIKIFERGGMKTDFEHLLKPYGDNPL